MWKICLLVLLGCATEEKVREVPGCPTIKFVGGEPEDLVLVETARRTCKFFYGEKSCLVELRRIHLRDYQAVCS